MGTEIIKPNRTVDLYVEWSSRDEPRIAALLEPLEW